MSTQRPVQLKAPQGIPETQSPAGSGGEPRLPPSSAAPPAGRGPSLMMPDLDPPATEAAPATLEAPTRTAAGPPATEPEWPADEPPAAESGADPAGRAVIPDEDPFSEAVPAPAPPPSNAGWKPLDWKPTRSPGAGRPLVTPTQPPEPPVFETEGTP
jgi:hypothetical protein